MTKDLLLCIVMDDMWVKANIMSIIMEKTKWHTIEY
jgi:hypothetical protein